MGLHEMQWIPKTISGLFKGLPIRPLQWPPCRNFIADATLCKTYTTECKCDYNSYGRCWCSLCLAPYFVPNPVQLVQVFQRTNYTKVRRFLCAPFRQDPFLTSITRPYWGTTRSHSLTHTHTHTHTHASTHRYMKARARTLTHELVQEEARPKKKYISLLLWPVCVHRQVSAMFSVVSDAVRGPR